MLKHISAGLLASLGGSLIGATAWAQQRPNIVVFLVDDMGLMDTSVPFLTDERGDAVKQPLNEWYRTPHMERPARQGIRFSTFYAQSVSSPSRTSIMTGQNAARHRTTNWINAESNNRDKYGPKRGIGTDLPPPRPSIPPCCKRPGIAPFMWGRLTSVGKMPWAKTLPAWDSM